MHEFRPHSIKGGVEIMAIFKPLFGLFIAIVILVVTQTASAVGLPSVPNAHFNAHHKLYPEVKSFTGFITDGKEDVWLRWRYENVHDSVSGTPLAGTGNAEQFTLRAALGYTTARYYGFYLRLEGEANVKMGDQALNIDEDFRVPPGPVGSRLAEGHAIIPDNEFAEWNEAYIGWRLGSYQKCGSTPPPCGAPISLKVGRQTIIYDNHRWIGDVIWRQNNVSMDAGRIDITPFKNFGISYAYVNKVKRLFGAESIFDEFKMDDAHLINASYTIPDFGKFSAYGYLLDFDDNRRTPFTEGTGVPPTSAPVPPNVFDSDTWGVRFEGRHAIGDSFDLLTDFEWANQDPTDDAGDLPNGMSLNFDDNDYYNIELGVRFGGTRVMGLGFMPIGEPTYQLKVGYEVLEGQGNVDGPGPFGLGNALQTPLATVHAFQGWADVFVGAPGGSATPAGGIEDLSITLEVLGLFGQHIGKNKIVLAYHDYEADESFSFTPTGPRISDYGSEVNFLWGKPDLFGVNGLLGAIKYANYDADDFSFDTEKYWVLFQYRYK